MDKKKLLREGVLAARKDFGAFVYLCAPLVLPEKFVSGKHIELIARKLTEMAFSQGRRLMLAMPPGSCKSTIASILYPAWLLGVNPSTAVLQISHSDTLATDWGRQVRNLVDSYEYKLVFPDTEVASDSRSAGRWHTTRKGRYLAAGAGAQIAGFRGATIIMDDVIGEQTAESKVEKEKIRNWYAPGVRTRLLPGGNMLSIGTRWCLDDLTGHLMKMEKERAGADKWEKIVIPAILDQDSSKLLGHPKDASYWPEMWRTEEVETARANTHAAKWNALYMQNPVAEGGNIFPVDKVRDWVFRDAPPCQMVIASVDTAYSTRDSADYTACTVWGSFDQLSQDIKGKERYTPNAILLGGFKKRLPFNELILALEHVHKTHHLDCILVEAKASGQSVIQELQRMGLPVVPFTPDRDKVSRAYAAQPFFVAGKIWMKKNQRFAEEVMEDLSAFPRGEHDDIPDSVSQAMIYFRQLWLLGREEDYKPLHVAKALKTTWEVASA